MTDSDNNKPIPRSVLIFGAAGHIGGPLADFLHREAPQIKLRLVSSRPEGIEKLRADRPYAEVVTANYMDLSSLQAAVEGIEGVFVNSPPEMDEHIAMPNLVTALKKEGTLVHLLRTVGLQPEANYRRLPPAVREAKFGLPMQHPGVKKILDESDLPVTYMNLGASFMDNFLWMKGGLVRERKLVWHNRLIPLIDPREIAEVAGRLLLSDNHRHIGQFHTLNNGHDLLRYSDVADLMSEVFGEKITHDGSLEAFTREYGAQFGPKLMEIWNFFEYERANEVVWARNDFVERMLGRKPRTLRQWLEEHAELLLK